MRPLAALALASLVPLVSGCCPDVGCLGFLALAVEADGAPVRWFEGTVTVGEQVFEVDCTSDGTAVAGVTCGDGTLRIESPDGATTDTAVSWALQGYDDDDTGVPYAPYSGEDSFTPTWETFSPNGEACGPTCTGASGTITLEVLD